MPDGIALVCFDRDARAEGRRHSGRVAAAHRMTGGEPRLRAERLVLTHEPAVATVRAARLELSQWLRAHGKDALVPGASVVVDELISNAVLHAATPYRVEALLYADSLMIKVSDGSQAPPRLLRPSPEDARGRGLMIVDRVASRWGVEVGEAGKTVWAELDEDDVDRWMAG